MNTSEMIDKYFEDHAGTSSYIDEQLRRAQQAVRDADKCQERNELDYAVANLVIARSLVNALADTLMLYPSHIWDELIVIFHSVDNKMNELLAATKYKR